MNDALKEELTAISQYFLHAEMCENWHYHKLGDYIKKQSVDEMKHAEVLIERILKEEEGHIDWLEAQIHQMKELGYERYLSQQIREES